MQYVLEFPHSIDLESKKAGSVEEDRHFSEPEGLLL